MIKLVLWGVRKAGITHADYHARNHIVHGDLVRKGPPDFRQPVLRYTQSYAIDAGYGRSDAQRYDSVSELWYESTDQLAQNFAHPYYQDTILPDGANFAEESLSNVHLAAEEIVGESPLRGQGLKVVQSLATLDGTDPDEFEDFWSAAHEAASPEMGNVLGYTRNRPPRGVPPMRGVAPAGYAGVWLDGLHDVPGFQAYNSRFLEVGKHAGLLDVESCFFLLCEERRVIDTFTDAVDTSSSPRSGRSYD